MGGLARNFEVVPLAEVMGKASVNVWLDSDAKVDQQEPSMLPVQEERRCAPDAPEALRLEAPDKDRELQTRLSATALKFLNTQLLAAESQLKAAAAASRRTQQRQAAKEARIALRLARAAFCNVLLPEPELAAISERIETLSARVDGYFQERAARVPRVCLPG